MEQARLLIAIALSFLVFLLWQFFFVDHDAIQKARQTQQAQQVAKEEPYVPKDTVEETKTGDTEVKKSVDTALPSTSVDSPTLQGSREITISTPLYEVRISESGALFESFVLKNYRESVEADAPLKQLISKENVSGTVKIGFAGNRIAGLNRAVFRADHESDAVDILDQPQELSFSWTSAEGVVVEKRFLFSPDTYAIGLKVVVKNGSDQTVQDNLTLSLIKAFGSETAGYGFEGPSALINGKLEQVKIKKIEDKNIYPGKLTWIAVQDRYFISCLIPETPVEASMRLFLKPENNVLENQFVQPASEIRPGTQQIFEYQLFLGPKSTKILGQLGHNLNKAINFGMFDFIAKPCVWIMNFLYSIIPNYGIAIIVLTLMTKILLWPLGSKSYKSMAEMKKIQPLMTEIREKYKNDKKKMNEEVMALYKTYKVNPMGGCLPMIVQIPVFFALYRMLYESIELRHAPFFLWINDLSAPDRLFNLDISIPLMQPPYGIPVLTIIMGGTMFLQQKMSPPMGDPAQAKMMMLMPIIFTFIFINFSSGLVLYWLVNNVLSIAQQYYITKKKA
jgi:YidC/Oxa1 family membrane protein insertase